MTEPLFRSDMKVELVDSMASDTLVCDAARISTGGNDQDAYAYERKRGLINYLMKNRHGTPFEHNAFTFRVECPIFVAREFMRHRIASYNEECLAGDTVVTRLYKNPGDTMHKKNSSLAVMWRNWHEGIPDSLGRVRKLSSCRSIYVRSYDENTLKPVKSRVVDIKKNGVKTTYLVRTESGREIRATMNHWFFTPTGWYRLKDLEPGFAHIYRSGKKREGGEAYIPPRTRQGIQVWTTQQKPLIIPSEGTSCYLCGNIFEYKALQLDHEVPVIKDLARALDITNLKPACKKCHRTKTNSEQILANRGNITCTLRADRIVSVSNSREEETYDLVLEDPHHNFLGNGLVVHNSGRYKQLDPVFWVPDPARHLVQTGKPGHYSMRPGTTGQGVIAQGMLKAGAAYAYEEYEYLLSQGICREVARTCLPLSIYTSFYVTMNARGIMNFLSLRIDDPDNTFTTKPQYEIEQVALGMQEHFSRVMPVTYDAFDKNGRVAP
jgi:thymidylate synthase (FAD)